MKKITDAIVKELKGKDFTLDELKRHLVISLNLMFGNDWTEKDYNDIFTDVLYELH